MVGTGAILLVLAQGRHCVTSHWGIADGASLADAFNECVQFATDLNAPDGSAPFIVRYVVQRFGAGPGKPRLQPSRSAMRRTGRLLAASTPVISSALPARPPQTSCRIRSRMSRIGGSSHR